MKRYVIAGLLVCWAVVFFERSLKLDDPVGAISVHGVNGLFGMLAVGIFSDGTYGAGLNGVAHNVTGLLYGGTTQILAQGIGVLSNLAYVGGTTFVAWKLTGLLTRGHRVSEHTEELGLDLPEMGALAYPDMNDLGSAVVLTRQDVAAPKLREPLVATGLA